MEPREYWWLFCQSLFTPSDSEDVTQLVNEYIRCKLDISFCCSSQSFWYSFEILKQNLNVSWIFKFKWVFLIEEIV